METSFINHYYARSAGYNPYANQWSVYGQSVASQPNSVSNYSYLGGGNIQYEIPKQQVDLSAMPQPLQDIYQVSAINTPEQANLFNNKPQAAAPVASVKAPQASVAESPVKTAVVATGSAVKQKQNFLMEKPFRYMGFLNEYAEMLHGLIPPQFYSALWLAELGYVGSEAALSAFNARKDAKMAKLENPNQIGATQFAARGLFHSMATIAVPTLMISGVNSPGLNKFFKGEQTGLLGGIKGIAEKSLKNMGAPKMALKYGPAAATFLALPALVKVFDPLMEGFVEKTIHKFLPVNTEKPVAKTDKH